MFKVFGGGLRNGSLFYVSGLGRNSHHEETVPDRLGETDCQMNKDSSGGKFQRMDRGVNVEESQSESDPKLLD